MQAHLGRRGGWPGWADSGEAHGYTLWMRKHGVEERVVFDECAVKCEKAILPYYEEGRSVLWTGDAGGVEEMCVPHGEQ